MYQQARINYFEFSIESDNLKKHILDVFSEKKIQKEYEFSYRKSNKIQDSSSIPDGYTIHQVDNELLNLMNEQNIKNRTFLTERIQESWKHFDDFFKNSLAFCITYCDRIIAVIVGTGKFNRNIAIDIETEEEHRNKGLGLILASKYVNECIKRGMTAQWDCVESNLVSQKLAKKAGFKFLRQNEVYWFSV